MAIVIRRRLRYLLHFKGYEELSEGKERVNHDMVSLGACATLSVSSTIVHKLMR